MSITITASKKEGGNPLMERLKMTNYETVKTPDFTWKVYRLEDGEVGFGSKKEVITRKYWEATFAQSSHAKDFIEFLKQKKEVK